MIIKSPFTSNKKKKKTMSKSCKHKHKKIKGEHGRKEKMMKYNMLEYVNTLFKHENARRALEYETDEEIPFEVIMFYLQRNCEGILPN